MTETPDNHTQSSQEHASFTRTVRQNKIAPKDGSQPLTVVEFSLIPAIRDSLAAALLPYVRDEITADTPSLKTIIESHIPAQILEELRQLNAEGEAPSTVYVIKNLPELSAEDIAQRQYNEYFLKTRSYANVIGKGIGEALEMQRNGTVLLKHTSQNYEVQGSNLHKHPDTISGISGVFLAKQVRPQTRFTDLAALSEDPDAQAIKVGVHRAYGKERDKGMHALSDFKHTWPAWKERDEIKLRFDGDKENVEAAIDRHSQRVVAQPGDLILWSNHSRIFHEALPARDSPYPEETITRIALGHLFQQGI